MFTPQALRESLSRMKTANDGRAAALADRTSLAAYAHLCTVTADGRTVWTAALQTALDEHETVEIPDAPSPYYLDKPVRVPSNRRILAHHATLRALPGTGTLLLQNAHPVSGTFSPLPHTKNDENITVDGGVWEACGNETRGGCRHEDKDAFPGVSTCFFFGSVKGLTVKNAVFRRCTGFAVQTGDAENVVFSHIRFEKCLADGLHINGGVKNVLCRDIRGEVGDDIVALNMYDWFYSSVHFASGENILCEDIVLAPESPYKAIRLQPGVYRFPDGTTTGCHLSKVVFSHVRGIKTFKLYFQSPPYPVGGIPEGGGNGRADDLVFEDIEATLDAPIDLLAPYTAHDPVLGSFAVFEFGSLIGRVTLRDVHVSLDKAKTPTAYLACVGPKSTRKEGKEIFDPYLSSRVETLILQNVTVNGTGDRVRDSLKEITFDDPYGEGAPTTRGTFGKVEVIA